MTEPTPAQKPKILPPLLVYLLWIAWLILLVILRKSGH